MKIIQYCSIIFNRVLSQGYLAEPLLLYEALEVRLELFLLRFRLLGELVDLRAPASSSLGEDETHNLAELEKSTFVCS